MYGNNSAQNDRARTGKGGKMKTSDIPHAMAESSDGTYLAGDNKNSWVGVALLQDLFIREHNWICDQIAAEVKAEGKKEMSDEEIFVRIVTFCSLLTFYQPSMFVITMTTHTQTILQ